VIKPTAQSFPSIEDLEVTHVDEMALDMSTRCVGWAVGVDRDLTLYGKYVFKSTAEISEKLLAFSLWLNDMLETFTPKRLLVERPLSRRATTTARHYELMGVVRTCWYSYSGKELAKAWIISPTTVKSKLGVERGGDHDANKQIMVDKVNRLFSLDLAYSPHSAYKSDDDIADAIGLLETYWRLVKN